VTAAPPKKMYVSCALLFHQLPRSSWAVEGKPSALDPADHAPREAQRVRGIAKPALRTLEHLPLIDEVVERGAALRDEVVNVRVCLLREGALAKRVRLACIIYPRIGRRGAEGRRRDALRGR
jgi:hypothetical protein